MGHRTYLNIVTKETSEEIFEANNAIPLFWLTLLDKNIINDLETRLNFSKTSEWKEETEHDYCLLKIERENFSENARAGKNFIESSFPIHLQLYKDFIHYLKLITECSQHIEINILEFANFSSISMLLNDLRNDVEAIKNNNPKKMVLYSCKINVSFNLTGYDGFLKNEFKTYSPDYNAEIIKQEQEKKASVERNELKSRKEKTSKKRKGILMILFGGILLSICVIGVIKNKLSTSMEIGWTIFGLLSIITGVAKVKNMID